MRSFRKIALSATLTLFAFSAVLYSSCKDKCGGTTCQNGGTCTNNVCSCPTGYSGNDCAQSWAKPYLGTYTCRYTAANMPTGTWQSVITTDASGGYAIDITNFSNGNRVIVATVDSLKNQEGNLLIVPSDSVGVRGSGVYSTVTNSKGEITITYNTTSGGGNGGGFYTFVMDKQ